MIIWDICLFPMWTTFNKRRVLLFALTEDLTLRMACSPVSRRCMHCCALYSIILDMRLSAMEKGTTVASWWQIKSPPAFPADTCLGRLQRVQKTASQLSQSKSSSDWWLLHLGITSRCWEAMRSRSWFTKKLGGRAAIPPRGTTIEFRQIGQLRMKGKKYGSE